MSQFWAGFLNDKLHVRDTDDGQGGWACGHHMAPALYTTRAEARTRYEDVRKVEIRVVGKPKKRK
jgi:hypothetical protein